MKVFVEVFDSAHIPENERRARGFRQAAKEFGAQIVPNSSEPAAQQAAARR